MPKLKLTVEKLEAVDEPLRPLYVERDGKYELDVDGIQDMRAALKTANEEAKTLRLKYKGIDPEEYAELKTQLEELRAKSGPEAIESIKQQLLTAHGKEKARLESRLTKLTGELERALVDASATAEIVAAKGSPVLLLPHVKKFTKMVEGDNGHFSVQVVNERGEPRVRDDGTPMSLSNLIGELRANTQFGRAFEGNGSSGSGMGAGGGGGGAAMKRSKMSVDEKSAYVAEHGVEKFMQLPY